MTTERDRIEKMRTEGKITPAEAERLRAALEKADTRENETAQARREKRRRCVKFAVAGALALPSAAILAALVYAAGRYMASLTHVGPYTAETLACVVFGVVTAAGAMLSLGALCFYEDLVGGPPAKVETFTKWNVGISALLVILLFRREGFERMFADMSMTLPIPTRCLMSIPLAIGVLFLTYVAIELTVKDFVVERESTRKNINRGALFAQLALLVFYVLALFLPLATAMMTAR
ncbi:MAG: hypothetical protein V1809_13460 [Planctomycetota bacterium]